MQHDVGRTVIRRKKGKERKSQLLPTSQSQDEREEIETHIDSGIKFSVTRKRMHNDTVLFRSGEEFVVDDVSVLDSFILGDIGESFLLDSSNVEDIRLGDDTREGRSFENLDTCLLRLEFDGFRHSESRRCDKVEGDRVE